VSVVRLQGLVLLYSDELLKKLREQYPNKATELDGMNEIERERYLAKLELLSHIALLIEDKEEDT